MKAVTVLLLVVFSICYVVALIGHSEGSYVRGGTRGGGNYGRKSGGMSQGGRGSYGGNGVNIFSGGGVGVSGGSGGGGHGGFGVSLQEAEFGGSGANSGGRQSSTQGGSDQTGITGPVGDLLNKTVTGAVEDLVTGATGAAINAAKNLGNSYYGGGLLTDLGYNSLVPLPEGGGGGSAAASDGDKNNGQTVSDHNGAEDSLKSLVETADSTTSNAVKTVTSIADKATGAVEQLTTNLLGSPSLLGGNAGGSDNNLLGGLGL